MKNRTTNTLDIFKNHVMNPVNGIDKEQNDSVKNMNLQDEETNGCQFF